MSAISRQRGAAIVVAVLIVALAASVAAAMIHAQEVSLRRLETARDLEQARWILRGGVQWARMILHQDARAGAVDHAGELWAGGLPATQVEEATLEGALREAQGRFNVNVLVRDDGTRSEPDIDAFRRLLSSLRLRPALADALAEQMAAPRQRLLDLAELAWIRGFDEATLARLLPFVTALPARTPVNVNFAPAEVLAAVVEGLAHAEAVELVGTRATRPFRDTDDFRARLPRRDLRAGDDAIAVQSRYFFVEGRVRLRNTDVRTSALLRREGQLPATVLWQRSS
jgi:general secretion pathway protein K